MGVRGEGRGVRGGAGYGIRLFSAAAVIESMSSKLGSYQELEIWKRGIDLATQVYSLSRVFPQEEAFGLTNQVRRAAYSIPANIAEGWGRGRTREFLHFLRVARGSLKELETALILAEKIRLIKILSAIQAELEVLSKQLLTMMRKLESRL